MKQTLTTEQAADLLVADKDGGWSYKGAYALAEYMEQLEEDTGEEIEFDRVARKGQGRGRRALMSKKKGAGCPAPCPGHHPR